MSFSSEEIAQLLTIGIPADGDLSAVEELQPGGVILFERNSGARPKCAA
jgi:hypothetical protein